jgi:Transposase IS116/IS110/IS902 family
VIGTLERFHCGKQIASYVGLVPSEESSGDRRRLGHINKQGNSLLRYLLVEAAQVTVRSQPQWRSKFFHLGMRRGRKIAKVAMARRLAVHLYCPFWAYGPRNLMKIGENAAAPLWTPDGKRIIYAAGTHGRSLYWRAADGNSPAELLFNGDLIDPSAPGIIWQRPARPMVAS